ncbi:atlastin-like isoform X2 [Sitodiplosis mosellana]|uniref:atlastin-like isoform X2 n=1 Tax=Sitodiplosis mosellana TaxID=263140 RepID=UPI0024447B2C|nr:atlastin-like isoform X2 [Sitodiplosis mosellana]
MRFNLVAVLSSLFALGVSYHETSEDDKPHSIQLVTPKDRTFDLNEVELGSMLNNDDFKDRHLVVISIAGPYRQGKSFLLNFFIRYLNAQYKKHDASNWLEGAGPLEGFKWRNGQKRETMGIWIWSDIFTHDYEDGRKVAIILMDTQGVFDHQTSTITNTFIFGLSLMMSSVQCYNLMHNIKEDNLQSLRLFSNYGQLSLDKTSEKSFQKLLFIVRDWPFAFESGYGWNGTKTVEEILDYSEDQAAENIELRKQIKESFMKIEGFLMPSPGNVVALGRDFRGDLNQINPNFKTYVKILAEELLSPDKLIVKKIGGQELTTKDWVRYLQSYVQMFERGEIPEPKDVFQMILEASHRKLFDDSLAKYDKKMFDALSHSNGNRFSKNEFRQFHENTKNEIFNDFESVPKFGDDVSTSSLREKIDRAIEGKFWYFKNQNDKILTEYFAGQNRNSKEKIAGEMQDFTWELTRNLHYTREPAKILERFYIAKTNALNRFDDSVIGEHGDASNIRDSLEEGLNSLENQLRQKVDEKQRDLSEQNRLRHEMYRERMRTEYERQQSPSFGKILRCVFTFGYHC